MRVTMGRWALAGLALAMVAASSPLAVSETAMTQARAEMVARQLRDRGVRDARLLAAMGKVPRHRFVPETLRDEAYNDMALPVGYGQIVPSPYVVALMTENLRLRGEERVLEIGTGSGYQAAVLAELAREVYTIQLIPAMANAVAGRLQALGYHNVTVKVGDGAVGWSEQGPFDAILVAIPSGEVPQPLVEQLREGGRLVAPVGGSQRDQRLLVAVRQGDHLVGSEIALVRSLPAQPDQPPEP